MFVKERRGLTLAKESMYTVEDIYRLPDKKRAELIDGEIYMMAPPSATHQRISGFLHWVITDYIRRKKGGCEAFAAPFAVFLKDDGSNYLEPDLTIICDKDKVDEKGCHGRAGLDYRNCFGRQQTYGLL